nr:unnamed protein product [Spirometra erinaceieuropaei]
MHGPCEVLGRQCLKFRSCACPKRDKDNNERRIAQDMVEAGLNGTGQIPSSKRRRDGGGERASRGSRNTSSNGILSRSKGYSESCNDRVSPTYSAKLPAYRDQLSGLRLDSDFAMADDLRSFDDRQNLIQLNGETFHVILMPAYLPGGASTLRQMRSALLKTFYAAKDLQSVTGGFFSRDSHDQDQKLISDESCFVIENKQSSVYEESFIQFIQSVEGKAASLIREMQTSSGYQTLNPFMSASCSTDSQPNSTASLNSTLGSLMGGGGGGGGGEVSQQGALDMLASHVNGTGISLDPHGKLDDPSLNFLQAGIAPLRNSFSSPFAGHKMVADGSLPQNHHHNYLAGGEQAFSYPVGLSQQQQQQQQQHHQQQQSRRLTYPQLRLPPLGQSQLFDGLPHPVGPEVAEVSHHVRNLFSPANGGGELAPPLGSASSSSSSSSSTSSYSHPVLLQQQQQQAHSTFQTSSSSTTSSASIAVSSGPLSFRPQTQKSVGAYQSDVFLPSDVNQASPGHLPHQQGQRLLETAQALVCSTKASSPTASVGIYMNQSKMFEDISGRTRASTDTSMSPESF